MLVPLLCFYGCFLILCGIGSVVFIGMKAKTALASGGISGVVVLLIAYLVASGNITFHWGGIVVALGLFFVFSWRSAKTLFRIFELIPSSSHADLKGKGIAFLIISLMAVVSLVVFILQVVNLSY
jgi:hypothetical protein